MQNLRSVPRRPHVTIAHARWSLCALLLGPAMSVAAEGQRFTPADVALLEAPHRHALDNANTPQDAEALRALLGSSEPA